MRFNDMTPADLSKVLGELERKQIFHSIEAKWWRDAADEARRHLFAKMAATGTLQERPQGDCEF